MTKIKKKLVRCSAAQVFDGGKNRAIVVTLGPKTIGLRTKGTREEYMIPIATVLRLAIEAKIRSRKRGGL